MENGFEKYKISEEIKKSIEQWDIRILLMFRKELFRSIRWKGYSGKITNR